MMEPGLVTGQANSSASATKNHSSKPFSLSFYSNAATHILNNGAEEWERF